MMVSCRQLKCLVVCLCLFVANSVLANDCQLTNSGLNAMPELAIQITPVGAELSEAANEKHSETIKISVKLANNNATRAAGFQSVCESTIKAQSILFVFANEIQPRFHMRNVVAPLDIAFIDKQGHIVSIQTMQPYVLGSLNKPTYYPPKAVIAALETYDGFFTEYNINLGSKIHWEPFVTKE